MFAAAPDTIAGESNREGRATMTSGPHLRTAQRPARRAAFRALMAAAFALAAGMPAPLAAQDCEVGKLSDWVSTSTMRDVADQNFECLQRRIEALERERAELARQIEQIENREELATAVYVNRDGRISREGRHLGPATFILTGDRRGRPRSLELDRARVVDMCGDAEGCLISLGLEGVVIGGVPIEAAFSGGACHFHLDPRENDWTLSGRCAEAGLPAGAGGEAEAGHATWGRDGDARPLGGASAEGRVILAFGGACLLAEAQPDTRATSDSEPRFQRDIQPDLFLVTAGAGWEPAGAFPADLLPLGLSDPDFRCSLTIRD